MPSVSSLSHQIFNNLGPLTEAFKPAASCATATNNVVLTDGEIQYGLDCNTKTSTLGGCYPSGSKFDSVIAGYSNIPQSDFTLNYFSPATGCPGSWTTVGVASKDGKGSLSSEGLFTSADANIQNDAFVTYPPANILMTALATGEAAVLCCPSGFDVNNNLCVSTLPAEKNTYTEGCVSIVPAEDYGFVTITTTLPETTVTGAVFTLTDTKPITETSQTTVLPSDASSYHAISIMPMVTLVNKGVPSSSGDGGNDDGGDGEGDGTGDGGSGPEGTNAAAGGRGPSYSAGKAAVVCAAVWAVAAAAGAAFMLPA